MFLNLFFNSLLASSIFCGLLIIFANSLDPDLLVLIWVQTIDTLLVFLKEIFEEDNVKKSQQMTTYALEINWHAKS